MNEVNEASPASVTSDVERVVMRKMKPDSYAGCWVDKTKEYTLKFDKDDWCHVFFGRKKVWKCNGSFARAHFYA